VDGTALASSDVKFVSESNLKITLSVAVLSVKGTKKIQVVRTGAKAATSNTMGLEVT
jgi:hypothetical protein